MTVIHQYERTRLAELREDAQRERAEGLQGDVGKPGRLLSAQKVYHRAFSKLELEGMRWGAMVA